MAKGIYKRGRIWWITYIGLDGKQYFESSKSDLKADAEYMLACKRKDIGEGKEPSIKRIKDHTFSELAEKYLDFVKIQRCFKSKKGYIKLLLAEFGANLPLKNITLMQIEQYQSRRISDGKKPATVNRAIATLKHCVHKGYQWEMLPEETLKRVRQVKLFQENNMRLRFLSREECKALIDSCMGVLKSIVVFALNTGCRKGEILSLEWEKHVDLRHGFITLDKTKNGNRREIPINDTLRSVLQGLTRRLDVPYVFLDPVTGKPYKDVKRSFKTAKRRAGIRDFKFHDTRHTFASHLVMGGVDITTVSKLLGHKSLTMTLRYAHLAPSHLVKAVEILDRQIGRGEAEINIIKIQANSPKANRINTVNALQ